MGNYSTRNEQVQVNDNKAEVGTADQVIKHLEETNHRLVIYGLCIAAFALLAVSAIICVSYKSCLKRIRKWLRREVTSISPVSFTPTRQDAPSKIVYT